MGGECKQQSERRCQVWQLAVGGESNPIPHFHMPCSPGGGRPGSGLQLRTYEGGCRSVCSGSMTHPVQHFYPAGRMKKWFLDTKEWFWDGMFVMKTENPTKSASHYCLPFPRPMMRLPRMCTSRLVEIHHVHAQPMIAAGAVAQSHKSGDGAPQQTAEANSFETPEPQTPLQFTKSSEDVQLDEVGSNVLSNFDSDSRRPDDLSHESLQPSGKQSIILVNQTLRETDHQAAEPRTMQNSGNVVRISHVSVEAGSPPTAVNCPEQPQRRGGKADNPTNHSSELTYVNYGASSLCPRNCRRLCCQCANLDAIATTAVDVKELVNCYIFVADMPGLKHSEIKVQVENDNVLKISGEQMRDDFAMETEIKYIRVERNIGGRFIRKFNMPADTNLDGISAACQDGLLFVIVPKNPLPDPLRPPRCFDVDVHSASISAQQTTS